jgi:prepilin-type processing-associated H-X9-DG protein
VPVTNPALYAYSWSKADGCFVTAWDCGLTSATQAQLKALNNPASTDPTKYPLGSTAYKLKFSSVTDGLSNTIAAGEAWHILKGYTTASSGTNLNPVTSLGLPTAYPSGKVEVNSVASTGTPVISSGYTAWGANAGDYFNDRLTSAPMNQSSDHCLTETTPCYYFRWNSNPPNDPTYTAYLQKVITGPGFAFMSGHAGNGGNFLFMDGSVHFLSETIDPKVYRALGSRNGGEVVDSSNF